MSRRVGLVACCGLKAKAAAPARELYRSSLFTKSVTYLEARVDVWHVLSAKLGVVDADQVVEPYDVRLGQRDRPGKPGAMPIWTWAQLVTDELVARYPDPADVEFIVIAGEQYRTAVHLLERAGYSCEVPLKGLGIGQQLGHLTAANRTATR